MRNRRNRAVPVALLALAVAALGFAGTAQAKLVGEFERFQYCPYKNTEVKKCLYSVTEGGEVKLGNKTVPIEKDVILQGGFGKQNEETKIAAFFGATEGQPTLVPVSQNVPGGLAGIVPEKEANFLVKRLIKFFFENSLTGLGSTLELAGSPSAIQISESHLARAEGVALHMPVKVHLENPFLGSNCYVGSNSSPIVWNLTTGVTAPPAPNESIKGESGQISFLEEGLILKLSNNKLVDNAWAAPKASGCGGILSFLVDPIVNTQLGTTTAGHNTAILDNTIYITTAAAARLIDEKNP